MNGLPLEELFDRVADLVFFVKDRQGRYTLVNETLVRRCGLDRKEELLGRTALEVFPAPQNASYFEQDRQVLEEGHPVLDQLELHLYPQGEAGWCITNKLPIEEDGEITGLVGVSRDLHLPADDASGYRELADSIRHIQENFGEGLRVETLARMSSLSPYQYEQRMKKAFGLTAGQFITRTRMEAACRLLRETDRPIGEIALDCGFYDQSAFTRQFKATTGFTPRQYRSQVD